MYLQLGSYEAQSTSRHSREIKKKEPKGEKKIKSRSKTQQRIPPARANRYAIKSFREINIKFYVHVYCSSDPGRFDRIKHVASLQGTHLVPILNILNVLYLMLSRYFYYCCSYYIQFFYSDTQIHIYIFFIAVERIHLRLKMKIAG